MARLTKIYTRTGDKGTTRLGTGETVTKNHAQVEAYGAVDELNSLIGVALAEGLAEGLSEELLRIQHELFDLGGELCMIPSPASPPLERHAIHDKQVVALERACDLLNAKLGVLENFILPGGSSGAARLHLARAVCRRAERRVVTLSESREVASALIKYLNRLSDLLFIMARFENDARGSSDQLWEPQG